MKKVLILTLLTLLSACSLVPSRWDDNQSKVVTDMQFSTRHLDCTKDLRSQLTTISNQTEWFDLYSVTKGTNDVKELNDTFAKTVKELQDRLVQGPVSPTYCELKKKVLVQQADIIANAVQFRF